MVGALLGRQDAKSIEIQNCFEVEVRQEDEKLLLNMEYFREREKLCKLSGLTMHCLDTETFPDQTFLGLYVTGDHLNTDIVDHSLYEQALQIGDFAFLLKLNPIISEVNEKIPLTVFEAPVDHQRGGETVFSPVPVKVVSDVAERIGTDHATRYTVQGDKQDTTAAKKLGEQHSALTMLHKGLSMIMDYLKVSVFALSNEFRILGCGELDSARRPRSAARNAQAGHQDILPEERNGRPGRREFRPERQTHRPADPEQQSVLLHVLGGFIWAVSIPTFYS